MGTSMSLYVIICTHYFLIIICVKAEDIRNEQLIKSSNVSENILENTLKKTAKLEENYETDDDYNDYTDESESARQARNRNINFARRIGTSFAWGRWDKWTKCTKSCVQIKRRPCIEHIQNNTETEATEIPFYPDPLNARIGCLGIMRKYRLCKDEKCRKSSEYLRDEQCEEFERMPYKGKFYTWRGYEKEHNECELFCKAADSDVFVSMNKSVTDGTPCQKPSIYYTHAYRRRAVCVEGICRAVHVSGVIRPATTNDSRLKCGSVLCRVVSELFSKPKLPNGYNYVATIAAGAMNVSIKQMAKSANLLALKSIDDIFIINDRSDSGTFEYNEDTYEYNREQGIITSKGPLNKAVVLLLFVRAYNSGIKYDYTIPVPSAPVTEDDELQTQWNELGQPLDAIDENTIESTSVQMARPKERKRRRFSWKLLGFGQCNRSCGPGVQPPIFRCIRESPTRYYSPKRCADMEKPTFSEDIYHCNRGLCPAYWRAGDYSKCRCDPADTEIGVRTRRVHCVQEQISGTVEEVSEDLCEAEKLPELTETCTCPRQLRRNIYAQGSEAPASIYSRLVGAPSTVRNIHLNNTLPLRRQFRDDRVDRAGVWLMSEWNEECAAECPRSGAGYEHRSIYCDRTAPYTDLCDLRYTPDQKRPCSAVHSETTMNRSRECHRGVWFASKWSNCSGDCFNLQRKRIVLCLLEGVVVDEGQCAPEQRPIAFKNCSREDVNYCGPKWHYSEWSECSRSCGEGIQRRYIKCLEYDWKQNALVESNRCKYVGREPVYGTCNTQPCEELDGDREVLQNDLATSAEDCRDEFANCKHIKRQRLCKLQYYQTYCCFTCSGS